MKIELLSPEGNYYKANLHCHTNLSDGKLSPEEVKETYKAKGYSAVCFTDHELLLPHEDLNDEEFIALHGYEMAIKKDPFASTGAFMPVYHFNFIAEDQAARIMPRCYVNSTSTYVNAKRLREELKPYDPNDTIEETKYEIDWINDYLEAVEKAGFLITYNHPQWSLQTADDYLGLKHLHAIEVINGACSAMQDNTSLHYERMLRSGMNVLPVGGDDNHVPVECGNAWTMIQAPELTYDALITAYKKGDCYASEGPEIYEISLEDDVITVKTSPATVIALRSEGRITPNFKDRSGSLTEVTFPYNPKRYGRFFRIEVRDAGGYRAYSRAYTAEEIEKRLHS